MLEKRISLLVIEDDEIDRMAFVRSVKNYPFQVDYTITTNVAESRDFLAEKEVDVIFTDYYLDDGSARDILKISKGIPVIVSTGASDIQIAVEILKKGAYDFLLKDMERNYLKVLPVTIERVLEKKARLDNEKILSNVVTNIRDKVVIMNPFNKIVFVNPSFCSIYGYKSQEILGMPVEILLPKEKRHEVSELFGISDSHKDMVHITKDGNIKYVAVTLSGLYDEAENLTFKICVIRDISERIQMLEAIRKSQEQLRTIFDNSAVGIALFEANGKMVQFNTMLREFTGFSDAELMKYSIVKLSHPEDRRIDQEQYQKLLKGEIENYIVEKRLLQKAGTSLWVRLNISLVKDELGNPSYIIAIVSNISKRKEVEETLRATEVRVEGIMSSLEDIVYSMNPETLEVYYVNESTMNVFGLTREEFKLQNPNWKKLIHGGDLKKLEESYHQIVDTGRSDIEYRIITPNGDIKWIRDRSWLVKNEAGRVIRVDGIINDITKRKVAEQAHLDSEERYKTAIQSSVEAIYMLSPATKRVLDANDAFCELLGYTKKEALKLVISDFLVENDAQINNLITRIVDDGGGQLGERIWKRKDGKYIYMQVNASRIRQRDQEILFVVARDITEQKRIKDALEQERRLLKEVIFSAPIPMVLLDEDLRFVVHSKSWIQAYGPTRRNIIGQKLFEIYDNLPKSWEQLCYRGLYGEILNIPEEELSLPNGNKIYLRLAIHPWGDPEKKRAGIVLVAERIDELVQARKAAEEANQAKSVFLARITHELRTPLNAVLGYSQIMMKDKTVHETHKGYIDSMYRSGMHLLNMINDILDLSKIEASRMDVAYASVDLREMIYDLHEMFKLKCETKGIQLHVKVDESLHPFVETDGSKLNQVLINLMGNAVKFTEKGEVGLEVFADNILEKETHELVTFRITDSGIGIPQSDLENIFEPFHQVKNTHVQGTGLGLSITKRIVSLLGGQIKVESTLGEGSTFEISIPFKKLLSNNKAVSDGFEAVTGIKSPENYLILVADDVEHNRSVVRLLLERVGITVIEASNGQEAVEKFEMSSPDFVIMDIIMPVMDGVKAMSIIKKSEKGKETPIIALTASGFDDKRDKLLAAGFNDYILKPFTEPELLRSIALHGNVQFEFATENDKSIKDDHGINLLSARKQLEQLDDALLKELLELLELQELEEIIEFSNLNLTTEKFNVLSKVLIKAAQDFDFYTLSQLAKSVEK